MATQLTVLTVKNHKRLRFEKKNDFSFAKNEHRCPLMMAEVHNASLSFPIVFPDGGETIVPQAMLSALPNTNNCIAEDGTWKGGYLPLHFRRYPFFLGREKSADQAVILFDEKATHLSETEGKLLYNKRGDKYSASPLLNEIKDTLKQFDAEYQKTKALCKFLKKADVLTPAKVKVQYQNQTQTISGFAIVDWKKVQKLDDETLATWSRIGLIQLIHDHLSSLHRYGIANSTDSNSSADATVRTTKKATKASSKTKKPKKK